MDSSFDIKACEYRQFSSSRSLGETVMELILRLEAGSRISKNHFSFHSQSFPKLRDKLRFSTFDPTPHAAVSPVSVHAMWEKDIHHEVTLHGMHQLRSLYLIGNSFNDYYYTLSMEQSPFRAIVIDLILVRGGIHDIVQQTPGKHGQPSSTIRSFNPEFTFPLLQSV